MASEEELSEKILSDEVTENVQSEEVLSVEEKVQSREVSIEVSEDVQSEDVLSGEKESEEEEPFDISKWLENSTQEYKGINMFNSCLQEIEAIEQMEIKEDDIWVCSFPRSGTTLTMELVYLVQTLDFERANNVHLDERFPFLDILDTKLPYFGGVKMIEALPSPRFIKSHMHHHLLPEKLRTGTGKIIYTARNVRDAVWSLFSLHSWFRIGGGDLHFHEYFEKFMEGKVGGTPWSLHVRQFWEERKNGNILFLFFEETVKDMPGAVSKIAAFLNRNLTREDVKKICEHCSLVNMKENAMLNFQYYKDYKEVNESHGNFINTGKGGTWREHFTDDMNKQVDEMIKKDFAGSDLTYYNP